MTEKVFLDGEWILKDTDNKEWKAVVPGCVHKDILPCFKDLYYRDNNEYAKWIENENWVYERDFEVRETENAYIVFEGLDTYCDIEINGKKVASCDNMFIEHTFFVEPFLKVGTNNIRVRFFSPVKAVEGREKLEGAFTTERLHSRRIQCTYGWDWVERFVTCGIFRSVYIVYKKDIYCENAYIYTGQTDDFGAEICVAVNFGNYKSGGLVHFQIEGPGGELIYQNSVYIDMPQYKFRLNVENPVLWDILCNNNSLYVLKVTAGENTFKQSFGIRTLRILQKKDLKDSDAYKLCKKLQDTKSGKIYDNNTEFSSFEVILNNRRVMCKGANWVPCEPFPSEEKEEKITKILTMSKDAGVNVIRVWGGGIFECQHFYDECDRLGLLVIQDFLMACGQYPEKEEWFINQLKKEADYASIKLRNHPSLIWWNGDNENAIEGYEAARDYKGRSSALHGIAPIISKNDFMRPFLASSPYGGIPNASKTVGTTHNTQFLGTLFEYIDSEDNGDDYREYMREYTARFIAEEPCFGASSCESLKNFMTDEDIFESEDMWLYHTKGNPSLEDELYNYAKRFAIKLFGKFEDGEDKLFKLQYLQYEWVRITMENARRNRGFCNGIIYWMLNDCWPSAAGWSLIDYYCRPKAGLYAFKKYADNVIVSFDVSKKNLLLYLCNDGIEKIKEDIDVKEIDIRTGQITRSMLINIECAPGESVKKELNNMDIKPNTVVVAKSKNCESFYKSGGLKMKMCKPPEIISCENGILKLKSDYYIHVTELYGGYVYDDNFFMMLSGEAKEVHYSGNAENVKIKAYTLVHLP